MLAPVLPGYTCGTHAPRDRQNHPCNDKWKRHDQNYGIAHGASPFLGLESLPALFTVNVTTEDELAMNGP
jgi:hypothetical protein